LTELVPVEQCALNRAPGPTWSKATFQFL